MVTTIDMTTGRLIYRSTSADQTPVTAPQSNYTPPQPALQLLPAEPDQPAAAMPPELAQANLDVFLDRWDN